MRLILFIFLIVAAAYCGAVENVTVAPTIVAAAVAVESITVSAAPVIVSTEKTMMTTTTGITIGTTTSTIEKITSAAETTTRKITTTTVAPITTTVKATKTTKGITTKPMMKSTTKPTTKPTKVATKTIAKKGSPTTTTESVNTIGIESTTTSNAVGSPNPTTVNTTIAGTSTVVDTGKISTTIMAYKSTTTVTAAKKLLNSVNKTTIEVSTAEPIEEQFPFEIRDEKHGVRVRQCSCTETSECAREARIHLPACRQRCAVLLDYFGGRNVSEPAAAQCFTVLDHELTAVDACLAANVDDFCFSDASTVKYVQPTVEADALPAYAAYHTVSDASTTAHFDALVANGGYRGGAVNVKKARHAFARLRDFQACAWKCVLREAADCQSRRRCTAKYPPAAALGDVLAGCDAAHFHDHSAASCRCLLKEHGVRKLTGLCPLVRNRHFMARL